MIRIQLRFEVALGWLRDQHFLVYYCYQAAANRQTGVFSSTVPELEYNRTHCILANVCTRQCYWVGFSCFHDQIQLICMAVFVTQAL